MEYTSSQVLTMILEWAATEQSSSEFTENIMLMLVNKEQESEFVNYSLAPEDDENFVDEIDDLMKKGFYPFAFLCVDEKHEEGTLFHHLTSEPEIEALAIEETLFESNLGVLPS